MEEMNLLVTLDQNYLPPLQVLLTSLHVNQPQEPVALYLLHSGIPAAPLEQVGRQCGAFGFRSVSYTHLYPRMSRATGMCWPG